MVFITKTHDARTATHHAIAKLSGSYTAKHIRELYVECQPGVLSLRRLDTGEKPRTFSITAEEADAFVTVWMAFKNDTYAAKMLEEQRETAVLAEALRLSASIPEIVVHNEQDCWRVSVPVAGWERFEWAGSPDEFLRDVKAARKALKTFLERLEKYRKEGWHGRHEDQVAVWKPLLEKYQGLLTQDLSEVDEADNPF